MYKIFAHTWLPVDVKVELEKRFDLTVHNANDSILSPEEFSIWANGANGLICQGNVVDEKYINENKNTLEIISNVAVGIDNINIQAATDNNVLVTNTPGVLNMAVADMTMGLLLAVARRISEADRFTRAGYFTGNPFPLMWGADLAGETLGIIGMGNIGQEVARRANAFKLQVIYNNRNKLDPTLEDELQVERYSIGDLLNISKYVVLLCPLTKETYHLIGKTELQKMRKDSFLINISRGPVVDEECLVEALLNKRIAGAGLDVYENEPKFDKRLLKMDNVILTPHAGSATVGTRPGMVRLAASNIIAHFSGGVAPNCINKNKV